MASVPISVHLDHFQDEELVRHATNLPLDSLTIDMSHKSKAENLATTAKWVEICHARGIATEAEPGRIEDGEDGISDTMDLSRLLTTPEEAFQFIRAGVDVLAPAFGDVHGNYGPRGIQLDFDRLFQIHKVTSESGVFIALRRVDKFPQELTRKLVNSGAVKINVNRNILEDNYTHLQASVGRMPFTQLMEEGVEIVASTMGDHMDTVLSSGQA